MGTATVGEVALLAVGSIGSVVSAMALREAIRRHRWIRWSGNERASRVSRRVIRAGSANLIAFLVAATVGGVSAMNEGWFFSQAGTALALGLGVSVLAASLDLFEAHIDRRSPDVRAELDAVDGTYVRIPDGRRTAGAAKTALDLVGVDGLEPPASPR
jgi:hypothetical protein